MVSLGIRELSLADKEDPDRVAFIDWMVSLLSPADDIEYAGSLPEEREQYRQARERVEGMTADDIRGDTPEERFRWLMRNWLPPASS